MNKFLKFMPVAMLATAALTFTACSDDDDEPGNGGGNGGNNGQPSIENVFTQGLPANVSGATFTKNDKGQLTAIKDGTTTVTFEYGTFTPSRAHNFTVLMKERDSQNPKDGSDIYMELNKDGFVTYAYQVYLDAEDGTDEWFFEYDKNGQLTRLKRSEGGEEYKITYTNGDITKVYQDEEDGDHREYTIAYTNAENKTAVANKGCIMLFDYTFDIDMDEMETAYYAGLLGKATKNLPMSSTCKGIEGGDSYTDTPDVYHWEFNADKLPVKFWENNDTYDTITFKW